MKSIIFLALLLAGSMSFAGGGSSVGLGNPASDNCVSLGGTVETKETPEGQQGICVIEEWSLFNKMDEAGLTIPHHYDGLSMPNPASVNCEDAGGELKIVDKEAGQIGMCSVDEWKLYILFHPPVNNETEKN